MKRGRKARPLASTFRQVEQEPDERAENDLMQAAECSDPDRVRWLVLALREILLIESGRGIRHNMDDGQMWQAMTDLARAALEESRD